MIVVDNDSEAKNYNHNVIVLFIVLNSTIQFSFYILIDFVLKQ